MEAIVMDEDDDEWRSRGLEEGEIAALWRMPMRKSQRAITSRVKGRSR